MSAYLVYLFCLVVGFVFVLVSAVFGHAFGDHGHFDSGGGHADAGGDGGGVSMFSPIVMASFVTSFGAFGLIFNELKLTQEPLVSVPLSLVCAFLVALVLVGVLSKVVRAADSSSESQVATLVGQPATVITAIPAGAVGEIAYVQAGTRYTAPAREESGALVPTGAAVTITRIVGSQVYVARSSEAKTTPPHP